MRDRENYTKRERIMKLEMTSLNFHVMIFLFSMVIRERKSKESISIGNRFVE